MDTSSDNKTCQRANPAVHESGSTSRRPTIVNCNGCKNICDVRIFCHLTFSSFFKRQGENSHLLSECSGFFLAWSEEATGQLPKIPILIPKIKRDVRPTFSLPFGGGIQTQALTRLLLLKKCQGSPREGKLHRHSWESSRIAVKQEKASEFNTPPAQARENEWKQPWWLQPQTSGRRFPGPSPKKMPALAPLSLRRKENEINLTWIWTKTSPDVPLIHDSFAQASSCNMQSRITCKWYTRRQGLIGHTYTRRR